MTNHKTADPKTLEAKTAFEETTVGIDAKSMLAPRPDLNGLRVKSPTNAAIYLIDQGVRRYIPNPQTYNNLFRDWNGVIIDISINDISEGSSISNDAILAKPSNAAPFYLIDGGQKRWITSPAAMDKYYFAWNRIYAVPHILLDSIPTGPSIS